MIQELQKCPKAFNEFVEWVEINSYYEYDNRSFKENIGGFGDYGHYRRITDYELHSLLIEWLDSKGIYVMIDANIYDDEFDTIAYYWKSFYKDAYYYQEGESPTRTEATEQGIIKALEILEGEKK